MPLDGLIATGGGPEPSTIGRSRTNSAESPTQNFLFIGNSFTMRHELPQLVSTLAMEGNPGSKVATEIVGYGGRNLFQHWECFRSYDRLTVSTATVEQIAQQNASLNELAQMKTEPAFYTEFWNDLGKNSFYAKFSKKTEADWAADRKLIKSAASKHDHWNKAKPTEPQKFDYVVLQSWKDVGDTPEVGYFKYAAKFAEAAKPKGARPVLYLTAPFAHNDAPVNGAVAREQAVGECRAAHAFAGTIDAIVVPVPLAITLAQDSQEPVARTLTYRYKNDFHPNNTMAYLTACTFYAALYGKSPEGLTFNKVSENKSQNIHGEAVRVNAKNKALSDLVNPDGGPIETVFSDEERLFLQKTAWQAVQKFNSGDF